MQCWEAEPFIWGRRDGRQAGVSWWPGAPGRGSTSPSGAHSWGPAFICRREGGVSGGLGPLHPRSTTHGQGPLPPALAPHNGLSHLLIQAPPFFTACCAAATAPLTQWTPGVQGGGQEAGRGREREREKSRGPQRHNDTEGHGRWTVTDTGTQRDREAETEKITRGRNDTGWCCASQRVLVPEAEKSASSPTHSPSVQLPVLCLLGAGATSPCP